MRKHLAIVFATCLLGCRQESPPPADTAVELDEPTRVESPKPAVGGGGSAAAGPSLRSPAEAKVGLDPKTEVVEAPPAEGDSAITRGETGANLDVAGRPVTKSFVAEDLVIQEKRQIRIRRKPKKRAKPPGIEIIRKDGNSSESKKRKKPPVSPKQDRDEYRPSPSELFAQKKKEGPSDMLSAFSPQKMMAMRMDGASQGEMEEFAQASMLAKFGDPSRIQALQKKSMEPAPEAAEPEEQLDGFANRVVQGERIVSKPMIETSVDPKSTFSIDVDTGAYALARARLRKGYRPKSEDVRIEEFLNYFHYDYPEPEAGEFSVHLEAAPDPFATAGNRHLIRIGVKGRAVPDEKRPPAHLTFLVDVSGSMFGPDKLGLAVEALDLISRGLRTDDTVAIVTYAKGANVRLWPAGATERDLALTAIAGLEPGGASSLDEGLKLAYEVASTHYNAEHVNRVVLLSDGRANVGETDPDVLLRAAQAGAEDGVMLSTIGFGAKAFNDRMMEKLADHGSGSYFFVDSFREAQKVFGDQLCGTLYAIAEDVKIQVEFDRNSVLRHRLLGYENRKLEHREFRDDTVDAGEIGAGHSVTALYEVELLPSPAPVIASVSIRHKRPGERLASETNYQLLAGELRQDVRAATADFKFAAAVALFAQILRGEEPGSSARLSLVKEIASEGVSNPDQQPDRAEFLALLDEAAPYYVD